MILKKGDEIRVLALSKSMSVLTNEQIDLAKKKIESLGFKVTFGKHVFECDDLYGCASIESRLEDFHEAIKDKNVKCILAARGGYNVNQILDRINYDLVKNNPKVICGFSDITALLNAVYAKTGIINAKVVQCSYKGIQFDIELTWNKNIIRVHSDKSAEVNQIVGLTWDAEKAYYIPFVGEEKEDDESR